MISHTRRNDQLASGVATGSRVEPTVSHHELSKHYAALLRHVLAQQSDLGTPSYAIGITSCGQGEGVTTVAINLAITAARSSNRRVLLVDGNQDHAGPAEQLNLAHGAGLTEVLIGEAMLGECILPTSVEGMSLLCNGQGRRQLGLDYELADVATLLDEIKSEYDLVVFDLPQAHELSECFALAEILDGVFLIVEAGRVDQRVARRVQERLATSRAHLLGAIYNKHR
jgi:Mrp family chromosome partitioning ATPase